MNFNDIHDVRFLNALSAEHSLTAGQGASKICELWKI
jgi:hypothetical protein